MRSLVTAALAALVLLASFATQLTAGPYEDGLAAAQRGDHATAVRLWRPLAEQGHVTAQVNMGVASLNGYGVPKDEAEAERWFRKAAEQGHARAQNSLGNLLRPQSAAEPTRNPARAAEAVSWYTKAANQGFARAQNSLGLMYEGGVGVPHDYVQAYKWYSLASQSPETRDSALRSRDAVAAKMTPAQIADAQRLAREWKPQHATR